MTTLDNVKTLLKIDLQDTSKDNLLNLYITRATDFILNYCNLSEIPSSLQSTLEDIVVFNFRNNGIENVRSEQKGSLSETYRDTLPDEVIQQLNRHRRVRVL